jgi:DNA-directed RNA polymerase specialized sigma24 family protein
MPLTSQQQLITAELVPLANSIADRFRVEDARGVAYVALCEAVAGYELRGYGDLRGYAYATVYRQLLQHARAVRVHASRVKTFGRNDRAIEVVDMMEALPDDMADLLDRRYVKGHTVKDIAAELGTLPKTVRAKLKAARKYVEGLCSSSV